MPLIVYIIDPPDIKHTPEAAIYYSAGYIEPKVWWKLGFTLSLVYIPVWLIVGGLWWKILGLW